MSSTQRPRCLLERLSSPIQWIWTNSDQSGSRWHRSFPTRSVRSRSTLSPSCATDVSRGRAQFLANDVPQGGSTVGAGCCSPPPRLPFFSAIVRLGRWRIETRPPDVLTCRARESFGPRYVSVEPVRGGRARSWAPRAPACMQSSELAPVPAPVLASAPCSSVCTPSHIHPPMRHDDSAQIGAVRTTYYAASIWRAAPARGARHHLIALRHPPFLRAVSLPSQTRSVAPHSSCARCLVAQT
ncbi:hypothetical protein C8Q76DRAFT_716671 [Earliella scabrosa]|nr:hypothetical protein C8Q76DRAFT_716671 [Earliella scabrosa]